MEIISRATWGARPPSTELIPLTNPVKTVYVHHQGGGLWLVNDQNAEMENLRALQASKMSENPPYSDFPYHPAIYPSARIYEGRDERFEGGATFGANATSRAILWPGNYNLQAVTKKQLLATAWMIRRWISMGYCTPDVTILGHTQAPGNSTQCPGTHAMRALKDLRFLVKNPEPQPGPGALAIMSLTAIDTKHPATPTSRVRFVRVIPEAGKFTVKGFDGAKVVGKTLPFSQNAAGNFLGVSDTHDGDYFVVQYDDGGTFKYQWAA